MNSFELTQAFSKLNLPSIEMVTLTKWVGANMGLSLKDSLHIAQLLKKAHESGVQRGEVLRK